MYLTKEQRKALKKTWCRNNQGLSYRQFRKNVVDCGDYIMVHWCDMWLGIEQNGYTHS